MKDNNGVELEVGLLVAYNRSGDVEAGIIQKFGRSARRGWNGAARTIVWRGLTHTFVKNNRDGKISKVMRPRSLMVIEKMPKMTGTE